MGDLNAAIALFRAELPEWTSYTVEIRTSRRMTRFHVEISRLADTEDGEIRFYSDRNDPVEAMREAIDEAKAFDVANPNPLLTVANWQRSSLKGE